MKASLKFRDEDSPLLRAKLPLTVAGLPLSSGIAVGNSHDLTLHLATFFKAGPCCKLAYKPKANDGPFFLVLKTGFGLWGSPKDAPFAITAQFNLSGRGGDPFFSVYVKPKFGDFGLRKRASSVVNSIQEHGDGILLRKAGSLPNGNLDSPPLEKIKTSASDSNVVIGSRYSFKIEGLDREKKGRERRSSVDGFMDQDGNGSLNLGMNGSSGDAYEDACTQGGKNEQTLLDSNEDQSSVRLPFGFNKILNGWTAVAHSSLPLGKRAKLSIRWGMKLPADDWGNRLKSFTVSKLPVLLVDKISVEAVDSAPNKGLENNLLLHELVHPLEYSFLPREDSQELAHITALCYSMKRQLHLLSNENRLLQRAVEEIKTEFEPRDVWKSSRHQENLTQEERVARPQLLDDSHNKNEKNGNSQKNPERRRDRRDLSKKPSVFESDSSENSLLSENSHAEVSEELKKAILNASNRSSGEKKD